MLSDRSSAPSALRSRLVWLGAAAALVAAGPVLAQTKPPAKPPAAPATPAPAAPAPGAAGTPTPTSNVVQLKAEPSIPDWIKVCGEDPGNKKKICITSREFVTDQGQPVLAVAVYDVQGEPVKIARFIMPFGFLLDTGVRFGVDQGQPIPGKFSICLPNGCFAESGRPGDDAKRAGPVKDDFIASMKKGTSLNISAQNQFLAEVTFQVPLAGFGKSFDGPPIDPKVLEEQQKKLAAEMQKKAEERRKELEAAAAAGGTPGAAPAPKP